MKLLQRINEAQVKARLNVEKTMGNRPDPSFFDYPLEYVEVDENFNPIIYEEKVYNPEVGDMVKTKKEKIFIQAQVNHLASIDRTIEIYKEADVIEARAKIQARIDEINEAKEAGKKEVIDRLKELGFDKAVKQL